MIGLEKVVVNVTRSLSIQDDQNINRVLLLDPKATATKAIILVTENDWSDNLKNAGYLPEDKVFLAVEAFFSSSSSTRQKILLVGSLEESESVSDYLNEAVTKGDEYYFGVILFCDLWEEIENNSAYASFANSRKIFLMAETDTLPEEIINESYLILTHHNQNKTTANDGRFVFKYASQLFKRLEDNPNANAQMVLRETTGLSNSVLLDSEKLAWQTKFVNQYYKSQGFFEVSLGTVAKGESIEAQNFNMRFLERDVALQMNEFRVNSNLTINDTLTVKAKLASVFGNYKTANYLTAVPFDTPSDLRYYSVDNVEVIKEGALRGLRATIRYGYNHNVRQIVINIEEK